MDRNDAAWALGEEVRSARIPVVALSAMPLESGADRILAVGFAGYVDKPIEVRGFAEQVRRYRVGTGG